MKVLITGGLGSLGQQLIEAKKDKWEIGILDNDEYRQWKIREKYPECEYYFGNIRNPDSLYMVKDYDYVIHAAALKRIEICEEHMWEAVKTNVVGTKNVIDACIAQNSKMVYISTDKAIEPINFYGMTKAIAERMTTNSGFNCVRYGNVFGTRGSVVPIFFKQKKAGRHLTLTHPDMTRFVVTLDEAINLIEEAMIAESDSRIFVRNSPTCKILNIAEAFSDKIDIVGAKTGEKLHETLITSDEMRRTVKGADFFIITQDLLRDGDYEEPFTSGNAEHITEKRLRRLLEPWLKQL